MKRAKILLILVTLVSIAAGSLAYKSSCPNMLYRDGFDGTCTLPIATKYSIVPSNYTGDPTFSTHMSIASSNSPCNTIAIVCIP